MITYIPIAKQKPPEGVYVIAATSSIAKQARWYSTTELGWQGWTHKQEPTHWSPINLPGEEQ